MIFHFVEKRVFENNLIDGYYSNPTLETRGFIHSVTKENITIIAERYLQAKEPIVILMIDDTKVNAPIVYEESKGVSYPHIYGRIDEKAIIQILPFLKDSDNKFIINKEIDSKMYYDKN